MKSIISIIVAMDKNNLIGQKSQIPWHIPSELQRFRSLTMGKPIVQSRELPLYLHGLEALVIK